MIPFDKISLLFACPTKKISVSTEIGCYCNRIGHIENESCGAPISFNAQEKYRLLLPDRQKQT